jgi:hypothetical protein
MNRVADIPKDKFKAMVSNFAQHRISSKAHFPKSRHVTPRRPMKHLIKRSLSCGAFNNSKGPMEDFLAHHNIAQYRDRLKTEADPFKRVILHDLLAKEDAKLANQVKPRLGAKTQDG